MGSNISEGAFLFLCFCDLTRFFINLHSIWRSFFSSWIMTWAFITAYPNIKRFMNKSSKQTDCAWKYKCSLKNNNTHCVQVRMHLSDVIFHFCSKKWHSIYTTIKYLAQLPSIKKTVKVSWFFSILPIKSYKTTLYIRLVVIYNFSN